MKIIRQPWLAVRRILSAGLFVSLVLFGAGCTLSIPTARSERTVQAPVTVQPVPPTIASPAGLGPAETVMAFYNWYLAYSGKGGDTMRNPLVDGAYRRSGYVTAKLAERVSTATAAAGGGFDPFLCAQDIPQQVLPSVVTRDGDRAAVEVHTSFAGHTFSVLLLRSGNAWQIDDIRCAGANEAQPIPAAATPAVVAAELTSEPAEQIHRAPDGWQVYRNEEFRFQVGYPADWVIREEAAVEGQPPIGPENMKLVVMLIPQRWSEQPGGGGAPDPAAPVLAPFTVEVTLGTEDAFWAAYPPQAHSEKVRLANSEALSTVEIVTEGISIHRYIYEHPITADLRVALVDPINGFPDRRAAYPDVAAMFEEVANTFAWLD